MTITSRLQTLSQSSAKLFDRPFALSIGPQRSGTSWIDRYLRARGDICTPAEVKEVFFFDRNYGNGTDYYREHFRPEQKHRVVMEISTTLFDTAEAPGRVLETCGPDVRLLCPLRHPVSRSWSLYQHYLRYGLVRGSLQDACRENRQILSSSHYAKHVEEWVHTFGIDNIHFLFQEDMETNLNMFVMQLCNALQIPVILPSKQVARRYNTTAEAPIPALAKSAFDGASWLRRKGMYSVINAAKKIGLKDLLLGAENKQSADTIPAAERAWLQERLHGEIEALERLIGPIPQWQ